MATHQTGRTPKLPGARPMQDFTEGSIPRHILAFSWPMLVGNLLQALYNAVDSFWVGRYIGAEALGAVSVSFPVVFALVSLIQGITMAATTLVAQYRGARDHENVRRTVANSVMLISTLGILSSVLGYAYRYAILRAMRTPVEILEPAAEYLGIFLVGLLPAFLYNVFASVLRGLGDSRTATWHLAYATVLNIVLDPIFIVGAGPLPPMGIRGVALATVIAQVFSAVLTTTYTWRYTNLIGRRREDWRADGSLCAKLFTIGIPAALQTAIVSFSMIVVASLVNTFGPTVVAAFGAASRFDQFAFLPALSIGLAVSALVGQNLGAGKAERVREVVLWSVLLSGGITLVISLVALANPRLLIQAFTSDEAVLAEGARYLRVIAFNYLPLAFMFTITGVLRGAGDTFASMMISFVTLWVVRLPLAALLAYRAGWGASGIWWSIVLSTTLGALLNYAHYLRGSWKSKVVVQAPQPS